MNNIYQCLIRKIPIWIFFYFFFSVGINATLSAQCSPDTEKPIIDCTTLGTVTNTDASICDGTLTIPFPNATDNCDPLVDLKIFYRVYGPDGKRVASGSGSGPGGGDFTLNFPEGENTIYWHVEDNNGLLGNTSDFISSDPIEHSCVTTVIIDKHVPTPVAADLAVQPGECKDQTNYTIQNANEHVWYKVIVPLTGKITINATSSVNTVLCAYDTEGCTSDKIRLIETVDSLSPDPVMELTGLTPCEEIYIEVKSYDFTSGVKLDVCAFEPPLLCGTDNFEDSGAGNEYKDNESTATVICPDNPDVSFVQLEFTQFELQDRDPNTGECLDYMEIRDGATPDAPAISVNGKTKFCGDDLKDEIVVATNWPNGCLTVIFKSNDDGIVAEGWSANVECVECNLNFETEITRTCGAPTTGFQVVVNATGGSGTYEYSDDGTNWKSANVFIFATSTPSPVTLHVRDVNDHLCEFNKEVELIADPLELVIQEIINTDCNGENGGVIVSVIGGAPSYEFDLSGDGLTGGSIVPEALGDGLYKFNNLNLGIDPSTGDLRSFRQFLLTVRDANTCRVSRNFNLRSNCEKIDCANPSTNLRLITEKQTTYFCSEDGSNVVIEALQNINIGPNDTLKIYEGQGLEGTLLAQFTAANPPTDLPIFSSAACITLHITNMRENETDNYRVRVNCADCDFSVDIETLDESCIGNDGQVILTINGTSHYKVTLDNAVPKQVYTVGGNTPLVINTLNAGDWDFIIEELWFHCKETIRATIEEEADVEIVGAPIVINETCAGNDASIEVTVTGGSGLYEYSIDNGSNFTAANVVPDTTTPGQYIFTIDNLNGQGYYGTPGVAITLVVRDARFASNHHPPACVLDDEIVYIGNDCFRKACSGIFYDHPDDEHVTGVMTSKKNYDDNEPFTAIICPDAVGQFTTVQFNFFQIVDNDTLKVYDSNGIPADPTDADAALIAELRGNLTDNDLNTDDGFSITAKNASGCLTFDFVTDDDSSTSTTGLGWLAEIECHGACAMELENSPEVRPETCEASADGALKFSVVKGSGDYTYHIFRINPPAEVDTLNGALQFNADGSIQLSAGTQADIDTLPAQSSNEFTGLVTGTYAYIIADNVFPNCDITGLIDIDRYEPITAKVKSPGLACGKEFSTVTILPYGGSGRYKITPIGIEEDAAYVNEGEEFEYQIKGAGNDFEFKISDVENKIACYEKIYVDVTDNCKYTCYTDEVFSSKKPYNGPAGYANYEHVEVTYCPHGDDKTLKADFRFFDTELDLDVLTIYHGKGTEGTLLGRFSGKTSPGEIISTASDGCLTFVFETNLTNNAYDGFRADLTCVECPLSASYDDVAGETYCWDKVNGDKNGSISIKINERDTSEAYRFRLFKYDENASPQLTAVTGYLLDNNDNDPTFPDGDSRIGYYQFEGIEAGDYVVKVRVSGKPECTVSLLPVEIEKIEQLEVDVKVTNVNCEGEGGKVCFVPTNGSGSYHYQIGGMNMTEACFDGLNGQTITVTVIDTETGCSVVASGTIGNDCHWTCDDDFFDDAGWDNIAGNADDGTALYAPDMDERWIFCPTADDKFIQIDFTQFKTEEGIDILTIIDGDGTGTVIGAYSGDDSPGVVRSTTGCLTVAFKSDGQVEKPGWAAEVSCFYCPKDFEITGAPVACEGHNGSIDVGAVATGYSNFLFALNPDFTDANSTGIFTDLSGKVTVYVKIIGLEACVTTLDIYEKLAVAHSTTDENCDKDDGSITINATGGSGNYEFIVDGTSYGNNNIITGLSAGLHIAKVIDGTCNEEFAFEIKNDDDGAPDITSCPGDRTALIVDNDKCKAYVFIDSLKATDCKDLTITNDYNNGGADASGYYPLGETKVTFTVSDGTDVSTCSFIVTVKDTIAPEFVKFNPADPILAGLEYGDSVEIDHGNIPLFSHEDVEFTDNCEIDKILFEDIDRQDGSKCSTGGYFDILECKWTAVDKSGNRKSIVIYLKIKCPPVPSPDLVPNTTNSGGNYVGGQEKVVIININESNGGPTDGEVKFFLSTPGGFSFDFDPTLTNTTVLFPETVNNPDWTVTQMGTGLLFTSNAVIPANGRSRIALKVTANTPGTVGNLTVNIVPASGGEEISDADNNTVVLGQSISNTN